ncbi:MAG: Nitrilotriacetate monooxygenase component A [Paracidovorax wautersii]|uniref:Nitrilotriacetate monooxygenase component A n=1 Tax=Paracidovorax wautersii TaxID=1177982 RepID=A0A7V8FRU3_9BURK|nr:MAG: Nitrilotriacetate monooxygenase component A [Paracidovorax wautersii]
MASPSRQIRLGAFLMQTGHHIAAWRHPDVPADAGSNFRHYVELAQLAESAKFDAIFLADAVGVRSQNLPSLARTARSDHFEPLTLLSALSVATERIGLIATVSTSFNEPYNVARKFASLDNISGGRSGWNLVTSSGRGEAENFSREEHFEHALRYERAAEFHDIVTGLWDSWEDDSFVRDKASGQYFDVDKHHVLGHKGKHFSVRGPLNVSRSPQGRPVVVQAGASPADRDLAARTAEVIFVAHQTLAEAQSFYREVKSRAVQNYGRHPDDIKIMPGIFPVIGRTQAEAEAKFQQLQDLIPPIVGVTLLSEMIGADLSGPSHRRPPARPARDQRRQEPPAAAHRPGAAREPVHPRTLPAHRRRARPPADRGHARKRGRLPAGMVRERSRRRLQHHVAPPARRI